MAGGGLAGTALLMSLVGCSSDDNKSNTSSNSGATASSSGPAASPAASGATGASGASGSSGSSGLVSKPVDTTAQAKPGGVLRHFAISDPTHFDPLLSANLDVVGFSAPFAYQRLLHWVLGTYPKIADGTAEGQLAESYEISPDKLSITLKLRQGVTWDDRAPTNGRALSADDVTFSWQKFASVNQQASNLAYKADSAPNAPVESVTATDPQTIVMKLHSPDSRVISLLCAYDYLNIMPTESDKDFDPRHDVRGNGPWMLDKYEPSVGLTWARNPKYYIKGKPYPDTLDMPIVQDYAQQLAQFKAGKIYTSVVTPEDTAQAKKDSPATTVQITPQYLTAGGGYVTFGLAAGTPWHDVRLRQALSMGIDREAYGDAIDNRDAFAKQGIDLDVQYDSIVYAGWPGYFIDPRDSAFGPSAKYLTYNVDEAKKLITAAGKDGLEFDWVFSTERYGAVYLKQVDVLAGMFQNLGLKPNSKGMTYNAYQSGYSEKTYWDFDGVVHRAGRGWPSLGSMFAALLLPSGSQYHGTEADGGDPAKGDPKTNDLIAKIIAEFDVPTQQSLAHDFLKYYTERTYSIMRPTNAPPITVTWPAMSNWGTNTSYVGGAVTDPWINLWIDPTKAPLA
ncbi:MAG TPA: ABC transporter substrate-binding protein [Dehalococcoidia bacterium]|nr:ABC transporter substrate-binding protein [Dehalococcoidia bacterium]